MTDAPTLQSGDVRLVGLRAADAAALAPLLDDPALHAFIGGEPLSLHELEDRYRLLEDGAPPGRGEEWLNWVIRRAEDGRAVGTAQATVRTTEGVIAWVVARPWQGRGYAADAARALVRWLGEERRLVVTAHIYPGHEASERVACAAGMALTQEWVDGERVWRAGSPRQS
jgi:RimJ/RimL family protein N-acetyltransferase